MEPLLWREQLQLCAGTQGRGTEQPGAVWALTHLPTAALSWSSHHREGGFQAQMGNWGFGGIGEPWIAVGRCGDRAGSGRFAEWSVGICRAHGDGCGVCGINPSPFSLPFLFLRDSPHSLKSEMLLMAGAGEVTVWAGGWSTDPPVPPTPSPAPVQPPPPCQATGTKPC